MKNLKKYFFTALLILLILSCKQNEKNDNIQKNQDVVYENSQIIDLVHKSENLNSEEIIKLINFLMESDFDNLDIIFENCEYVKQKMDAVYTLNSFNKNENSILKIEAHNKIIENFEKKLNSLEAYKTTLANKGAINLVNKKIYSLNVILGKI